MISAKKGGDFIAYNGHKKKKGTKINLAINEDNLILNKSIMSGNRNDIIAFEKILNGISIKNGKVGRPKSKIKSLYADSIYDTKSNRNFLRKKDIISNIPINKRNRKYPKKGRKITINDDYVSVRGAIERVFGWLKMRFRKLETRYEYYAKNFDAFIDFSIFFHNWNLLR